MTKPQREDAMDVRTLYALADDLEINARTCINYPLMVNWRGRPIWEVIRSAARSPQPSEATSAEELASRLMIPDMQWQDFINAVAPLYTALEKYGWHVGDCAAIFTTNACTCGWDRARRLVGDTK